MTSIAQRKPIQQEAEIFRVDPLTWRKEKAYMYANAKLLANKHDLNRSDRDVLNCIISCCDLNGKSRASIIGLQEMMLKISPGSPCSPRTIKRAIYRLKEKKIIFRKDPKYWYHTTATRLCRFLVKQQGAKMAPVSITTKDIDRKVKSITPSLSISSTKNRKTQALALKAASAPTLNATALAGGGENEGNGGLLDKFKSMLQEATQLQGEDQADVYRKMLKMGYRF